VSRRLAILTLGLVAGVVRVGAAEPVAELDYRVIGPRLTVSPAALSVPRGIAGSLSTQLNTPALANGTYVEATLRGPAFPARRILGLPNQPLLLPPLNLSGDYRVDDIHLVDAASGNILVEATPSSIPVRVFDEVLVSRVTSRPLSLDEIEQRGILIDASSFRAVEFEVGFVLDGETVPIRFPVVAPSFQQATEVIPQAQVDALLVEAELINAQLNASLPPELEAMGLNIEIAPLNIQAAKVGEEDLALQIPPIPALLMIPGNIGFLNQFFSVLLYTENGAPSGSGLSVRDIEATLTLPPGGDQVPGTQEDPGDDPLRFARVGSSAGILDALPVVQAGQDGTFGTGDDVGRLRPGDVGQAEFLVEGLREGLHVMDLELTGVLDGLAAGAVDVEGTAKGSVLVRNPNFSLAFLHPRTVRSGEPYEAAVTLLNTGGSAANLLSVSLPVTSVSGATLISDPTVQLGTLEPGETATATFQLEAQRTGSITFSQLTSDADITGRFRLRMGIDERGVALSPNTLVYPDFVNDLPPDLLAAANRVLGQALSVATAGQRPPGVLPVTRGIITTRALELAEAGQRIRYGDDLERVLVDLMLDWQGGRVFHVGFDQILRETGAGLAFRDALFVALDQANLLTAEMRLLDRATDIAGRSERWRIAATDTFDLMPGIVDGPEGNADIQFSNLPGTLLYGSSQGSWSVADPDPSQAFVWSAVSAVATTHLCVLDLGTNGTGNLNIWTVTNIPAGACLTIGFDDLLLFDRDCDGEPDQLLPPTGSIPIQEAVPEVFAAIQDISVKVARPVPSCYFVLDYNNYGNVVAVLFSKPMRQEDVNRPEQYLLDNGLAAATVQIQPGGRVALLTLEAPVGTLAGRSLSVADILDVRGNALPATDLPVQTTADAGVLLRGRVVRADGTPGADLPVTLTYYDELETGIGECLGNTRRIAQIFSGSDGTFQFDFIMHGVPYSVSATDVAGLSEEAVAIILENTVGDEFIRENLLDLAAQNPDTLLELFSVGALPDAVAIAEGVDRAVFRDFISLSRVGTEVVTSLRFRGRGSVTGRVLDPDGFPVAGAAVNLFPDISSLELGRGLFTDDEGRFTFFGVPLGPLSVEASDELGRRRTVSGLLESVDQVLNLDAQLAAEIFVVSTLQGRVFEADGTTPHAAARVLIGQFRNGSRLQEVVALVTADADGLWSAGDIPTGVWDVLALSADGKRSARRVGIDVVQGFPNVVNLALQGLATVQGRVEFANGTAVTNALVAGGQTLVRTGAAGLFTLTGVPTGPNRDISAGLEPSPTNGNLITRIGSARLDVVGGADNFVVIRFEPKGSIVGRVLDHSGDPIPNIRVAVPRSADEFFYWTDTDAAGLFRFDNFALDNYVVSAPAPPAADTDVSGILDVLGGGSSSDDDILAALSEAFGIFTGINDPLLTGEGDNFNPEDWGFVETSLTFDGQVQVVDIQLRQRGTVSGRVENGQGVPVGARVRLTGIGPNEVGDLSFIIRGERNSDPATGGFIFPDQLLVGDWGLQAATPFSPVVVSMNDRTTPESPDAGGIVLRFPPEGETSGRLTGNVLRRDGAPAGAGIKVAVSFGDLELLTDSNGFFDTQIDLPARTYTVTATATGVTGQAQASVQAGQTNFVTVTLLEKGDLEITVVDGSGVPVPGAELEIQGGAHPRERFDGQTDALGRLRRNDLFEGPYSVCARVTGGIAVLAGREGATVTRGQLNAVTVTLTPTGALLGQFVEIDRTTPVPFAQITVGSIGFTATDAEGRFELLDMPLGAYTLIGTDSASGRYGTAALTLSINGETQNVLLVEQVLGDLEGVVISGRRDGPVPGARLILTASDVLRTERSVTAGPDGGFQITGVPPGAFTLEAVNPANDNTGELGGVFAEGTGLLRVTLELNAIGGLRARVLLPDGVTPAADATATLRNRFGADIAEADTDAAGEARFEVNQTGDFSFFAESMTPGETRSVGTTSFHLNSLQGDPVFDVVLGGVGVITGRVLAADGTTPVAGAAVRAGILSPLFPNESVNVLSDAGGAYRIENVPIGGVRITATEQALTGSLNAELTVDGEVLALDVQLGASASLIGRVVHQEAVSPAAGVQVNVNYDPPQGLLGRASAVTASDGLFALSGIPVGDFSLEAAAPFLSNGLAQVSGQTTTNGEVFDLGDIMLDQVDPFVADVSPEDTAADVSIDSIVRLTFNEALDPGRIDPNAFYIRREGETVLSSVVLLSDSNGVARIIQITPNAPLASESVYEVVVVNGDRLNAVGQLVAEGPRDLVGKPMVSIFTSVFTTRDDDPPGLLSLTPADGEIQVDPRAVVRLSFDEPIRPDLQMDLESPSGAVAGSTSIGVNHLVAVFTPDAQLDVNETYTATAQNVSDLAGNALPDQPLLAQFNTLDTLGPNIVQLRIKDGAAPVGGNVVFVEAVLAASEPDVSVRISADLIPFGESDPGVLELPLLLPESGSLSLQAIAIDRFGNEGPLAELPVTIVSNQPPSVTFSLISPTNGPIPSGSSFVVDVDANDDVGVNVLNTAIVGAGEETSRSGTLPVRLSGIVPAGASLTDPVIVLAEAVDGQGLVSGEQRLEISVSDGTPPEIEVLAPTNSQRVAVGTDLDVTVRARDNLELASVTVDASGAFTDSVTAALTAEAGIFTNKTIILPIPGTALQNAALQLRVEVEDVTGLTTEIFVDLTTADSIPPAVLSFDPADGEGDVGLLRDLVVSLSEDVDPTSATGSVSLTHGTGTVVAADVTVQGSTLRITPQIPLEPQTLHTLIVGPGLSDANGNIMDEPVTSQFTTTHLQLSADPVVAGAGGLIFAAITPDGIAEIQFLVDGTNTGADATSPYTLTLATLPSQTSIVITARAMAAGDVLMDEAQLGLVLESRTGDADGDGLLNGYEQDRSCLDPFTTDAGNDPDFDTLTNAEEEALGTNPCHPDTDADGRRDDVDPFPLGGDPVNSPPVIDCPTGSTQVVEDGVVDITLLANDADADPFVFIITDLPIHGTLEADVDGTTLFQELTNVPTVITGSVVRYQPGAGFAGSDSFLFLADDGFEISPECLVDVTVSGINDPPVANPDTIIAVTESNTVIHVMANDTDQEGDPLSIDSFTQPGSGTVSTNADESLVYTSNPGHIGPDSFSYVITDGTALSESGQVQVTVVAAADVFTFDNPGGGNWSVPGNWDQGALPGPDDLVVLAPGAGTVIFDLSSATVRDIRGARDFSIRGALTVLQNVDVDGSIDLTGGTLRQATVVADSLGRPIQLKGTSVIRLEQVTLCRDVETSLDAGTLELLNVTLNATLRLDHNFTQLRFVGTQTLSGTGAIRCDSPSVNVTINANPSGTVTLGPGITLSGGRLGLNDTGMGLVNRGTIRADRAGTTMQIRPGTLLNLGLMETAGGVLSMEGAWDNDGILRIDGGGTLNLGGTFTTAGIGTLERTGGSVTISGVLDNTGDIFAPDDTTGMWVLNGGSVRGGIYAATGTGGLTFNALGGNRLEDLVIETDVETSLDAGTLELLNVTLNATLRLDHNFTQLRFVGTQTLSGTGTIRCDSPSANVTINANPNGTVTLGPGITLSGGRLGLNDTGMGLVNRGTIRVDRAGTTMQIRPGSLLNLGLLETAGGVLSIEGAWDNDGILRIDGGGTLNLGSTFTTAGIGTLERTGGILNITGVLDNTGDVFAPDDTTGTWVLTGGTVQGGTYAATGAGQLTFNNFGGRLEDLIIETDLETSMVGSLVTLQNVILNATLRLAHNSSTLRFAGTQTLAGTGTIRCDSPSANVTINANPNGTVTLGPGITLSGGRLRLNDTGMGLVNRGTIRADRAGTTMQIRPGTLLNLGLMETAGGILSVEGAWDNDGILRIDGGGTLNLGGSFTTAGIGTFERTGGALNISGVLDNTGDIFAPDDTTGTWVLNGGTVRGGIYAAIGTGGLTFNALGGNRLEDLVIETDIETSLDVGTLELLNVTLNATLRLAHNFTALRFAGTQTLSGTGTIRFESPSANATMSASPNGTVTLGPQITLSGGRLHLSDTGMGLVNLGTIRADRAGTTMLLRPATLLNLGLIETVGAVLTLQAAWDNDGILRIAGGGTLNLGGSFTTAGIGTLERVSGTLNITGVLDNTGDIFAPDDTTGTWLLDGGTVRGGIYAATGAGALTFNISGLNRLENVVIATDIETSVDVGTLELLSVTLNATLRLAHNFTQLRFVGTQTLSGTGTIRCDSPSANVTLNANPNGTVTLGPQITLSGGRLDMNDSGMGLVNHGTIRADRVGTTMLLRPGSIQNFGMMTTAGGTIDVRQNLTNEGELIIDTQRIIVTGNFIQTSTGAVAVVIGGLTPVSQYTRLEVSGSATLAGEIRARLDGFAAQSGNQFDVVLFGSSSGGFTSRQYDGFDVTDVQEDTLSDRFRLTFLQATQLRTATVEGLMIIDVIRIDDELVFDVRGNSGDVPRMMQSSVLDEPPSVVQPRSLEQLSPDRFRIYCPLEPNATMRFYYVVREN